MKWSVTVSHMYSASARDVVVEAESEDKARVAAFEQVGEGWYVRPFEPNQVRPADPGSPNTPTQTRGDAVADPTHVEHEALLAAIHAITSHSYELFKNVDGDRFDGLTSAHRWVSSIALFASDYPEVAKANIFSCYPETLPSAGLLAATPPTQPAAWIPKVNTEALFGGNRVLVTRVRTEYADFQFLDDPDRSDLYGSARLGYLSPIEPDVSPDADGVTSPTKKEGVQ